ncbi:hypothetical protein E2C01_013003 [Portunus trituberculatus]|uniref:Uncharacterized protein n=1 Tax=Portunus trituberculatus TaxID=210409 RepID=A0A5B7DFS8_PORTR|nr:hypothetical protein [Portunus trituberculatus]
MLKTLAIDLAIPGEAGVLQLHPTHAAHQTIFVPGGIDDSHNEPVVNGPPAALAHLQRHRFHHLCTPNTRATPGTDLPLYCTWVVDICGPRKCVPSKARLTLAIPR